VISFNTLNMNGYFQRSFWSVCEIVRFAEKTGVGKTLSKTDFSSFILAERDLVRLWVSFKMFALTPHRPSWIGGLRLDPRADDIAH